MLLCMLNLVLLRRCPPWSRACLVFLWRYRSRFCSWWRVACVHLCRGRQRGVSVGRIHGQEPGHCGRTPFLPRACRDQNEKRRQVQQWPSPRVGHCFHVRQVCWLRHSGMAVRIDLLGSCTFCGRVGYSVSYVKAGSVGFGFVLCGLVWHGMVYSVANCENRLGRA